MKKPCEESAHHHGEVDPALVICHTDGAGEEERQDRTTVIEHAGPLTVHHKCPGSHVWHRSLVLKPGTEPVACDCEWPA